jgi:general secretion pathway protein G
MAQRGFTIIELLVVLAVIGLLLSIAAPRYVQHVDTAREVVLKQDLQQIRLAIDKFHADQSRYPATLDELVVKRYLRAIPEDPITGNATSWTTVAPEGGGTPGVFDVHSGAKGDSRDGSTYAAW